MQRTVTSRIPVPLLTRAFAPATGAREPHTPKSLDAMVASSPTQGLHRSYADAVRGALAPETGARARVPASIEVAIPKPHKQPYAHRTFMGLAGSMLRDPIWAACLQRCMPELHAQCARADLPITKKMRLLEGNPVLAAYGLWRGEDKALPMEWDLWLDPHRPADLHAARVVHGNAIATAIANSPESAMPGVADAIMSGARPGTDVHEGLTPARWMALFKEAATCVGLTLDCRAVYLDVKSSWSSAADVAAFVDALQQQAVETRGVLAFDFDQLAAPLQVAHPVHLTHSPAGLAMALPAIPHGAMVMFNGGALLRGFEGRPEIDAAQLTLVRNLRQAHNLRIGVYLQEDAVSPEALRVLIDCLNRESDTFVNGIAYGGLAGVAEGRIFEGLGTGCQSPEIEADNALWFAARR